MAIQDSVFICAPKRTAIGSFQGSLASVEAPELAAVVIRAIIAELNLAPDAVHEVILGTVLSAGQGQAPARQAAIKAGLSNAVHAMTVNKVCSSGLKAVLLARDSLRLGRSDAVIAGGMESMSMAPYLVPSLRAGARLGNTQAIDSLIHDALWDVYNNMHMGNCAELCADKFSLTREQQDAYAIESYRLAVDAIANGYFKEEIVPVEVKSGKSSVVFDTDEEPAKGNPAKIPSLKPVFKKDGTVTAANASSINDAASAMLLCNEKFIKAHNVEPIARIVSEGYHAHAPEWFTIAPVGAVTNALSAAKLSISQIDLFEINEAFSAVALACSGELKIPSEKLNRSGGAVALGHPVGASGARILTTLLYSMKRQGLKKGVAAICNGGGEASAVVVEKV